ncbi:MAG: hypothetical protein H6658_08305 [Ardenticatenaceae bacterium]|nr:hypothetical protein [Ardenticatenaceae bacterium]
MSTTTVTIPNVQLTIEQLITAVRQLEPDARSRVAQALLAEDMDERFAQLIERLAKKVPVADITDEDINEEIRAYRNQSL